MSKLERIKCKIILGLKLTEMERSYYLCLASDKEVLEFLENEKKSKQ